MSFYVNFETGNLSSEEAAALAVMLTSISPHLQNHASLTAERKAGMYSSGVPSSLLVMPHEQADPAKPMTDLPGNAVNEPPTLVPETSPSEGKVLRERGKPAPGRARRTKEEIAEDEAYAMANGIGIPAVEQKQAISTGEERVNPDEEQDAADEAAEETKVQDKELTIEDMKNAAGLYIKKWGIDITQLDGPILFKDILGNPPAGEDYWRFAIVPKNQETYAKVIKAWTDAAAAGKRYGQ